MKCDLDKTSNEWAKKREILLHGLQCDRPTLRSRVQTVMVGCQWFHGGESMVDDHGDKFAWNRPLEKLSDPATHRVDRVACQIRLDQRVSQEEELGGSEFDGGKNPEHPFQGFQSMLEVLMLA